MILTWARSGMARSGATRAGYPALQGAKVPLYALSNVARSGATRSNYHSSKSFIAINGIQYAFAGHVPEGPGILADSLTIHTAVNTTPATLTMTAYGFVPVEGSDLVITLGSVNNARREFAGSILTVRTRYVGDKPVAENMLYDVNAIDWMWGLNRRKVSGDYRNTTVAAIAASLMTSAPAGYALHVEADIGAALVDEISFTETTLQAAFTQLVKRVGGDYNCDYLKVVKLFFTDSTITPPSIVNAVHASMNGITYARDLSQVITRCLGEFGGSEALDAISPGETLIPVATAAWYLSTGGVVLVGEQRVTYGGIAPGGGGSLVGPGAAPTGAPNASLLPGAGVDLGSHDYAVTFKTASGESIPGPRLTVPVGVFLPPTAAPTPGAAGPGATGPDPGPHDYAISFTISTGETVPGPRVVASTDLTPPPTAGPTPDSVTVGPGPDPGQHDYAITFQTVTGETLPGPIGGTIATGGIPPPTSAPNPGSILGGPGPDLGGPHYYAATFVRPEGETTIGATSAPVTTGNLPPPTSGPSGSPAAGTNLTAGDRLYAITFVTAMGETTIGASRTLTTPATPGPSGPPTWDGLSTTLGGPPQLGAGLAPAQQWAWAYTFVSANGETTVSPRITIQNSSLNPPNPYQKYELGFPLGPAGTIKRNIYRTVGQVDAAHAATAQLHWEGSIDDNTTIKRVVGDRYDAQLGAPPPVATATTQGTMMLSGIQLGASNVIARRLYRSAAGSPDLRYLTTINDNVTTTFGDSSGDAALGAAPPAANTAGGAQTVRVSSLPIGAAGSGVVARKLYRTVANGSAMLYVRTIADNTTTSVDDTTPDSGLGAGPPPVNTTTAGGQTVHVSSIPRGTGASADAVTARKLYRRSGGAGLRYVATIPDNATSTYTDTTPNAGLGAAPPSVNSATLRQIHLSKLPIGEALVTARKLYRTIANNGGGTLKLVATIADNVTTDFLDTVNDAALGAAALTVGTAQAAQVSLTAIPIGAPAVIARVIYRTKAGLAQLQLLKTLNDNTTSAWLDVAADATLGANAPIDDTSLLQQPAGNILAGSTSLPCASVAKFLPAGGWAEAGSQNIRYTGISGSNLVGIPPSGPGAITATLSYNTTIVAAPMLNAIPASGVGAIKYPILKGDRVNIFVQEDDLDAQAAVRAQIPGSDGIIEDELQDGRLSYTEGRARCRARLEMLGARDDSGKVGIVTVNYVCRDLNSQAGATVTINIGPPINLRGSYLIQRVNATQYHVPNLNPTYTVEASSVRFTAEALLRAVRDAIT